MKDLEKGKAIVISIVDRNELYDSDTERFHKVCLSKESAEREFEKAKEIAREWMMVDIKEYNKEYAEHYDMSDCYEDESPDKDFFVISLESEIYVSVYMDIVDIAE